MKTKQNIRKNWLLRHWTSAREDSSSLEERDKWGEPKTAVITAWRPSRLHWGWGWGPRRRPPVSLSWGHSLWDQWGWRQWVQGRVPERMLQRNTSTWTLRADQHLPMKKLPKAQGKATQRDEAPFLNLCTIGLWGERKFFMLGAAL